MEQWTIGVVAKKVGLRPSALRYYESVGLLPRPQRVNGRRYYDATIFPVLNVLQMARQAGFTIADLRLLFQSDGAAPAPSTRWQSLATQKVADLDAQIAQAHQMKQLLHRGMECGCLRYEDCVWVMERHG
jgi:MerR family redox-sensitive transcriptional activator SoxR